MFGTLALNNSDLLILILVCFFAGLIRGFSGFGLSAFVMTLALTIIPPIELIPVCWWMEFIASVFLIQNGWKDSDKKILEVNLTNGFFINSTFATQKKYK